MDNELKSTLKRNKTYNRKTVSNNLYEYEHCLSNTKSQREASRKLGIPRSTLRSWKSRKDKIPLAASVIECLESPEGTEFLHRLITAIQFVMNEVGGCGIRLVSQVLELSHLNHFVGSSYETLRRRGVKLEETIIDFGEAERQRLSLNMKKKKISIAEDETFHPQTCLVAIEPISDFILLERYSEKRDAASWNKAMDEALAGLNIEIIQSTSDSAKGIVNHVEKNLGAHHSPDIFHVQYDISKACSAALSAKTRQAESSLDQANKALDKVEQFDSNPSVRQGRKLKVFNESISDIKVRKIEAEKKLNVCKEHQETASSAKKAIARDYHPYYLNTGKAKDEGQLEQELHNSFDSINVAARESALKDNALKKIDKARRTVPKLVQTLSFYWSMISVLLDSLRLSKELETVMRDILIPAQYMLMASKKESSHKQRKNIKNVATKLIKQLEDIPEWLALDEREQNRLYAAAKDGAGYFQRSSSCVEGRNGYLALRHHGFHQLSNRKLAALTTIHNYFIKRPDRTTAAERFFDGKPSDLFEYLNI